VSAGEDHVYAASAHHNVGDLLRRLGRYPEAAVELDAALAIYQRVDDPEALHTRVIIAKLARDRGDLADAQRRFEELLPLQIARLGKHHHLVADTINDLGGLAADQGELDRADQLFRRALAIYEEAMGPEHPRVAIALSNLGTLALARHRYAEARDACARALAIDTKVLGPDHPDLAFDRTCLDDARAGLGRR
jgi:tetratricopeptide (TPR) repeat protein